MKVIDKIEGYFLLRFTPDDAYYFRARLLVKFTLVSIGFAFGYWVDSFFTGFLAARYLMVVSGILFSIQLVSIRYGASLRVNAHFFVFFCWGVVAVLTLCSGGFHSAVLPWMTLIPIMGLLLLGRRVSAGWGIIAILSVLGLLWMEDLVTIPAMWTVQPSDFLTASLYIGLIAILLAMTSVFHRQGVDLLATTRRQHAIIEKHNDEIAARNESLEDEVEKRTRELLDYNQQLEQFAFIASHNLRAPVASLLGLGNLLEVSAGNKAEVDQICTNMITTARELDRVVRDLSTILEIRKSSHAVLAEINLEEEVKLIRVSLERELTATGATLETDFSEVPVIQTVRPLMDSILMNLISSAIKYRHPDRAPHIVIRTTREEGEVCLSVSDNDLGMDLEAYGEKLFTLYGRFHSHVDGKGLGLYLVKTHVMAMGGRIDVESEPEKGTTFRVVLKVSGLRPSNT